MGRSARCSCWTGLYRPGRGGSTSSGRAPAVPALTADEVAAAAAAIRELVDASPGLRAEATAAHAGRRAVPHMTASGWGQAGDGFAGCVRDQLPDLEFRRNSSGGWLLDPSRHTLASGRRGGRAGRPRRARVCRMTHAPALSRPVQYGVLFEHLAAAAHEHPTLNRLGAEVRERTYGYGRTGEPSRGQLRDPGTGVRRPRPPYGRAELPGSWPRRGDGPSGPSASRRAWSSAVGTRRPWTSGSSVRCPPT